MHFTISRDLAALRFVRANCLIPGTELYAGGTGFSITAAIARCRSECVERDFERQVLRTDGIRPAGIAAHPISPEAARESSLSEVIESAMIERLLKAGEFHGRQILTFPKFSLGVVELTEGGYFGLLRANYRGTPMLFYTARRGLVQTLLKLWEEYRNPFFHKTPIGLMARFSKTSAAFTSIAIQELRFISSREKCPSPERGLYRMIQTTHMDHHVVYWVANKEIEYETA